MVTRVYGKVDGTEMVLKQEGCNTWSVPVPLDVDGEYIVEIIAEDAAGNRSYVTKLLFCITSSEIIARIIPGCFYAQVVQKDKEYHVDVRNWRT